MAAVALAAAGCSQDEFADQAAVKGNTTIVASFEGADTRTSVNDKNEVVWNKDDAFGLFYTTTQNTSQNTTTTAAQFTATTADGQSTTATFSGTLDANVTTSYAVYPYQDGMKLDNSTVTMKLPATIDYTTASNGPMYAPASDISSNISFKHLAGLLKLSVSKGIAAEAKKFVITADKNIAGTATADLSKDAPVLVISSTDTNTDTGKTITVNLNFSTATTATTDFYIPIPAGSYSTLSAQLFDNSNKALSAAKEWSNITVTRAGMLTSAFGFVTIGAEVSNNEGIKSAISAAVPTAPTTETTTEVKVASTIDTSASGGISTIALPVTEKSNVGLSLEAVPTTSDNAPLVISDATDSNAETATSAEVSKNTVTVAIPQVTDGTTAPVLKITMPSSTVALDATGTAGTTYGTITAKTANNTLVVKNKVTVSKLIVAGGNVRVQNGGTITAIERATNFTDTPFLIKEEGATIPASPTGFTVISAAEYDLMMAAKNGGTYVLSADVTLAKPIVIKKDVVLDLNGHSIKPVSGELTIPETDYVSKDALIIVNRKATLTINDATGNGSIDANGNTTVYAAVKMTDAIEKADTGVATLIVNGGTLKGYQAGISGNGTRHNTEITINGGTITSANTATDTKLEATGIYHPQFGILNINGGTIKGYDSGIEMRAGKLTVSNGAIESTATTFSEGKNGNGKTIVGAAVSVSQHTTNLELNATIKGGTLTGVYALYEKDLQDTNVTGISMSVTAGNLNGKVYSQNCKAFAKGGVFTDPAVLNYLATGANVKVNMTADCSIGNINIANGQTVDMNLNVKTLTLTNQSNNNIKGKATFSNGNIIQASGSDGMLYAQENGDLTLDKIYMSGANYALWAQGPNVKLNVINKSEIHAEFFPISTNASINGSGLTYGQNAIITLSDSKFIGTETGFMNNVPAKVTITNCEFSGNHQAAFLRGGDYTITNSKFTLNATLEHTHKENHHFTTWSEGNQATFAALTIGNYKSTAYQYYTKVAMTKVTAEVTGTYASSFPAMHVCANAAKDLGVTLTYDTTSSTFTSSYSPAIEYGTTNITVNGKAVVAESDKFIIK